VTDDKGVTDTVTTTVNVKEESQAPSADFTYTPSNPEVGETVFFESTSSDDGTITSLEWQFDDGSTAQGKSASRTFSTEGYYPVELAVTDDTGLTDTETQVVSVSNLSNTQTESAECQPGPEEPQMQAVQLYTSETKISRNDPGEITGSIATDITNNCPVKAQVTLEVPNGVRIEGGNDIR